MRHMPAEEEKDWSLEAVVFFLGKEIGYVVSPHTFGEKCAIMNAYNELVGSKKESDRKFAKTFKPNKKFFVASGKYEDEKGKEPIYTGDNNGIKPCMLAPGQYQDLLDLFLDEDEAGDFTHPDEGYDIKYRRTGKGMLDTEYSLIACKSTPLAKKWRKMIPVDIEQMVRDITPSYKETKALLEQFMNLDPEEDTKTSKKKKSRDDDDEKPKKKRKGDL
jgi:hypothetical protein